MSANTEAELRAIRRLLGLFVNRYLQELLRVERASPMRLLLEEEIRRVLEWDDE